MNSDRILSANINVTFVSSDCISGNSHSLNKSVGVTLQNRTVHKCTGVTFVGVTSNIFLYVAAISGSELPLKTRGESCATTSTKTGIKHCLNDLIGSHLSQNLTKCSITVNSYVLVHIFRVNNTTITKCNSLLLFIELCLGQRCYNVVIATLAIFKSGYGTSLEQMFLNYLRNICRLYHAIECAIRVNDHNRTQCTKTKASGNNDLYFFCKTFSFKLFFERISQCKATGRSTTGTAANKNM